MAITETPRHKLKKYSSGEDAHPTRGIFNGEVDKLEALPAVKQGSTGSKPLSGVGKVLYWDESIKRFVYDDGSEWNDVAPIGGVTPSAVAVAGVANEGSSARAARGDHTHVLPLATGETPGAMSAEDKAKLEGIASGATALTLGTTSTTAKAGDYKPDVAGVTGLQTALNAKADTTALTTGLSGKADTSHTHSPATGSIAGFISAADKTKLDGLASNPADTGWQTTGLTINAGPNWSSLISYQIRKIGSEVWFYGAASYSGTSTANAVGYVAGVNPFTMPPGYRPAVGQWDVSVRHGTSHSWEAYIDAGGVVRLFRGTPNAALPAADIFYFYGHYRTD